MWGWRISLRMWISRATLSTSLTSCIFSFSSILTATFSLVRLWLPSLTFPNVPFPIVLPIKFSHIRTLTQHVVPNIFELTLRLTRIPSCLLLRHCLLLLSIYRRGLFALRGHCGHRLGCVAATTRVRSRVLVDRLLSLMLRCGCSCVDDLCGGQIRRGQLCGRGCCRVVVVCARGDWLVVRVGGLLLLGRSRGWMGLVERVGWGLEHEGVRDGGWSGRGICHFINILKFSG